jgi:hypothetical protein
MNSDDDEKTDVTTTEFDEGFSQARLRLLERLSECAPELLTVRTEALNAITDAFDEVMLNGKLEGFAVAITFKRGDDYFEALVSKLSESNPEVVNSPQWIAGIEPHDEVYRRGALAGFRLAITGDENNPDFVRTKAIVLQLSKLEEGFSSKFRSLDSGP